MLLLVFVVKIWFRYILESYKRFGYSLLKEYIIFLIFWEGSKNLIKSNINRAHHQLLLLLENMERSLGLVVKASDSKLIGQTRSGFHPHPLQLVQAGNVSQWHLA